MIEYENFAKLKAIESEKNYSILTYFINDSTALIFTPHGGGIEPGTSEIVIEVANNNFSYYCFQGHRKNCKRMHITSHKFDEPKLLRLLMKHQRAISIHGMDNKNGCEIYLGGLDIKLIKRANAIFKYLGFKVLSRLNKRITSLEATDIMNVTNKCKSKMGLQIEISDSLRNKFFEKNYKIIKGRSTKTKLFYKFCDAIKTVLNETLLQIK